MGPGAASTFPPSDRAKVCSQWRDSVRDHYKDRDCDIDFDAAGCVIEKIECEDEAPLP